MFLGAGNLLRQALLTTPLSYMEHRRLVIGYSFVVFTRGSEEFEHG